MAMPIYALDGVTPEISAGCWIAPDAVLLGRVRLLPGASVWFGAVLRGDNDWITIGPDSNVQDLSVIHTDPGQPVIIGTGVTIGHRVILHSAQVDDNSLIGMGSVLLNRAHIGQNCLVGAAALVTEDKQFESGKLILGAPARAVGDLKPDQIARLRLSAQAYVANGRRFAQGLVAAG
jgi:carbonic anhydrase/acetyltransferase-like protein (isoleucine patch superfamily)